MSKPTDLVQGTLDLLILKTIALEPMHGWAIAQRIRQVSKEVLRVNQGDCLQVTLTNFLASPPQPIDQLQPVTRQASVHVNGMQLVSGTTQTGATNGIAADGTGNIYLGGAFAGVFLGFALALLAEATDRTLHTESDVSRRYEVPLIVGVPPLFSAAEERVRNWKKTLEWLGGSVLLLAVFVAEIYASRHG